MSGASSTCPGEGSGHARVDGRLSAGAELIQLDGLPGALRLVHPNSHDHAFPGGQRRGQGTTLGGSQDLSTEIRHERIVAAAVSMRGGAQIEAPGLGWPEAVHDDLVLLEVSPQLALVADYVNLPALARAEHHDGECEAHAVVVLDEAVLVVDGVLFGVIDAQIGIRGRTAVAIGPGAVEGADVRAVALRASQGGVAPGQEIVESAERGDAHRPGADDPVEYVEVVAALGEDEAAAILPAGGSARA